MGYGRVQGFGEGLGSSGFDFTVDPRKLEHGLRRISARIHYTTLRA